MQPYSAFNNNPIYYNDPTGMIVESPLSDYGLDKETGNVTLIKETNDKTDTLYAGTGEGDTFVRDKSKGSVTVKQHDDGSSRNCNNRARHYEGKNK